MDQIIYGRLSVYNAINGKRKISKVYIYKNIDDVNIINLCKKNKIPFIKSEKVVLDKLAKTEKHQGVVAVINDYEYASFKEELNKVKEKKNALVLMLDGILDPVNLGSIIRSAGAFNVDFIILRQNREVEVTSTVVKVSTGATEYVPIVKVTNLSSALETLKENGFWSVASTGKADMYYDDVDYNYPIVLIVGNEGDGISEKILKEADFKAKIPMPGKISSLNAGVATAVFLAEIVEQRRKKAN